MCQRSAALKECLPAARQIPPGPERERGPWEEIMECENPISYKRPDPITTPPPPPTATTTTRPRPRPSRLTAALELRRKGSPFFPPREGSSFSPGGGGGNEREAAAGALFCSTWVRGGGGEPQRGSASGSGVGSLKNPALQLSLCHRICEH